VTDDQIERAVERKKYKLDARYMASGTTVTKAEYDAEIRTGPTRRPAPAEAVSADGAR
jgi:hypothetical protein